MARSFTQNYTRMVFSLTDVLLCLLIFQLLFVSGFLFSLIRGKHISNVLLGGF